MSKYRMSDLEIDIRKLGKYTRFIATISTIAMVLGILAGLLIILSSNSLTSPVMVPMGLATVFISLMAYWINQYFVYMGRGMTFLMEEMGYRSGQNTAADPNAAASHVAADSMDNKQDT